LRRQLWSEEQDQAISALVEIHGTKKWAQISKKLEEKYGVIGRTGKQIRERWNNHLNPEIRRDPISLEEGVKIFKAHNEFGNRWAEITTQLPGRTDNTVKNYFYATVRRHLRKLNKWLRSSQFWESFNIEANKQVKLNFLIEALEHGDLDYFKVRSIESKELLSLAKKKLGGVSSLSVNEKRVLKTLDGEGKPMDKNLSLLRSMLELVKVDLTNEVENWNADEEEEEKSSIQENKSISFKNFSFKNYDQSSERVVNEPDSSYSKNKRFKIAELNLTKAELKEENWKNNDDINIINPMNESIKEVDLMNPERRMEFYNNIYKMRQKQKSRGKWKTKNTNYCTVIFSYKPEEYLDDEMERNIANIKNDMTFNNIQRNSSMASYLFKEKDVSTQPKKFNFATDLKIETGEDLIKDDSPSNIKQDTPNYGADESECFTKTPTNLFTDKSHSKFYIFKPTPLRSPYANNEFRMPTPTITKAINSFKPQPSPNNDHLYFNIQTPVQSSFPGFRKGHPQGNPGQNLARIFGRDMARQGEKSGFSSENVGIINFLFSECTVNIHV
jgi:hypothetical protein